MRINNSLIIDDQNKLLREKSNNVPLPLSNEDRELLQGLYEYVLNSTDEKKAAEDNLTPAVGIAAVQVGIKKKLLAIVIRNEKAEILWAYALANPKIIAHSLEEAYLKSGEGCLSVPTPHEGYVYRYRRIKVRAYDLLSDSEVIIKAKDYLAIVLQHEIDHFNGILYYDHLKADPFQIEKDAHMIA